LSLSASALASNCNTSPDGKLDPLDEELLDELDDDKELLMASRFPLMNDVRQTVEARIFPRQYSNEKAGYSSAW